MIERWSPQHPDGFYAMHIVYLCLFVCLTIVPILVAWYHGDRILDGLARRRRIRRQIRRRRITRSLPVRAEVLDALLMAEGARDSLEDQVGNALIRFRSLPPPREPSADRDDLLQDTAQHLLTRESRFSGFLDLAWLQSETIEILTGEVEALRQIAGIRLGAFEPVAPAGRPDGGPAQQLLKNLGEAASRRETVDRKLRGIRQGRASADRGRHFDTTVE